MRTTIAGFATFLTLLVSTFQSKAFAGPEPRTVTVTVTGQAPGVDLNAMEQAKQDALKKAVEEACGTFITSQTKTRDYAAVYDKIISLSAGFVTEYDVLDRKTADGMSRCKVRATVSTAAFEAEWAQLLHTLAAEGNPNCVVVVIEDNNVDDVTPPKADGVVQSVLERFFIDKGVQLMDKGATDDSRERDMALAALNDDVNKLAAMAAAFKAEVVIRGVAEARMVGTTELSGRTLYKWSATLTIRAYHTDSAQLLMSNVYSQTKPSVNENQGGDEALKACAEKFAGPILSDIGKAWAKRQNVHRTIQLTLDDCSRRDFKAFQSALSEVRGVKDVRMKDLVNSHCRVEIDWEYDLERLASRIEEMSVDGVRFEITEQTHDRLTARLVRRGTPESDDRRPTPSSGESDD